MGNEFAGAIEATGKTLTGFYTGNKVFGYNNISFDANSEYIIMPENGIYISTEPGKNRSLMANSPAIDLIYRLGEIVEATKYINRTENRECGIVVLST